MTSILSYFIVPPEKTGNIKAKCKRCNQSISGHCVTTSNFIKHLQRKHEDLYKEYVANKEKKVTPNQQSITNFVTKQSPYHVNHPRRLQITDRLINFIASNLLPLSVVENEDFKLFCAQLDERYTLPSRKHFRNNLLLSKVADTKLQIQRKLRKVNYVCVCIDIWSSRHMRSYVGITCHTVIDWKAESLMLACKRLRAAHTGDNIYQLYEEVINDFDIQDKIVCIITDNARNMKKAFHIDQCDSESEDDTDNETSDETYTCISGKYDKIKCYLIS